MADLNQVNLIGRLTRDPVVKTTQTGLTVGDFGLATSRKYKAQDGTQKEDTVFVDISCFSFTAENVGKYMKKGCSVFVGGRLKLDTWKDQAGETRQKLRVVAENVQFLSYPKNSQEESQNQPIPDMGRPISNTTKRRESNINSWTEEPDFGTPPF